MGFKKLKKSLSGPNPPQDLSVYLLSLWYDAKGNWTRAHDIIDDVEDKNGCWVHAYLHRKEGDIGNADYWYRKAGKQPPQTSLDDEWNFIARELTSE